MEKILRKEIRMEKMLTMEVKAVLVIVDQEKAQLRSKMQGV